MAPVELSSGFRSNSTVAPRATRAPKGQKDGRYLVVQATLLDQWKEVFILPVGKVEKVGSEEPDIRIIDDYSFPEGSSIINDFTDRSEFPDITYNPPADIVRRIFTLQEECPRTRILLMLGDVSGAFRHVPIHADQVHMFAFVIDDLLVIDMTCGLGWCGSLACYFLPGAIIKGLYEEGLPSIRIEPTLTGSFWCDDHTCVEVDEGDRCFIAILALRRAMATVLESSAISERKSTQWSESGRALGLIWDTINGEVGFPGDKISKAKARLTFIFKAGTATKSSLQQFLGSLRHVATCCNPARAFYQRVQDMATALSRYGHKCLDQPATEDLKWFQAILHRHTLFNRIYVSHFANVANPTVNVHMDASNDGLCVLEPARRQFIRVRFTKATQEAFNADASVNSINVMGFRVPCWPSSFGDLFGLEGQHGNLFTYAYGLTIQVRWGGLDGRPAATHLLSFTIE